MAVNLQVTVSIDGKESVVKVFDDASKAAKKFGDDAAKTKANWAEALTGISTGYLALKDVAAKAFEMLKKPIELAIEQESANRRLANSLKLSGQYTDEAYEGMKDYAEAMEKATGVENELISATLSANQTFGLSTSQAKATTEAALGLAKATGVDLATANDMLLQTLNGHDRALKKILPQVGALTEAQLRNGEAVKLVQKSLESLNGQTDTTATALQKIQQRFEDILKDVGGGLLKGFDLGVNSEEMTKQMDEMAESAKKLKPIFEELGKGGISVVVGLMNGMVKAIKGIDEGLTGIVTNMLGFVTGLKIVGAALTVAIAEIQKGVASIFEFTKSFGKSTTSPATAELDKKIADRKAELDTLLRDWKTYQQINDEAGGDDKPGAPPGPKTGQEKAKPPKTPFTGKPKIPQSREQEQAELAERASINEQILALESAFNNEVQAEYQARLIAIETKEKEAKDKGLHLEEDFERLKVSLRKAYDYKLAEQARKVEQDIANATGETRRAIEAGYDQDEAKFQQLLDKKLIDQENYDKAVAESRRNADNASRQTTGSSATDDAVNGITNVVTAVQSGVSSIVSTIGSMFGPIGSLVAALVNFFNQTPEEFKKFIDGLMNALIQLPQFLAANIPVFIEELIAAFPRIVASFYGQLYNINFWVNVVKAFVNGLVSAFKAVFSGEAFKSSVSSGVTAATKQPLAKFGSDDPNAGGGEFKIKDLQLSSQRKQAGAFEDTFPTTVDEAGKSFAQMIWDAIKKAFDDVFDQIGEWGTEIWKGLVHAATSLWSWGRDIWLGFWQGIQNMGQFMLDLGIAIWRGFWNLISPIVDWFYNLGKNIWNGLWGALQGLGAALEGVGRSIAQGFLNAGDIIAEIGKKIGNAIADIIGDLLGTNGGGGGILGTIQGIIGKIPVVGGIINQGINVVGGAISSIGHALGLNKGGYISAGMANPGLASVFSAMGAMHFASGGEVPGTGFDDKVPALLTPGERVLTRQQNSNGGGASQVINFTFNVEAGATLDKAAVQRAMPQIIDQLKRESNRGTNVLRPAGVY